MTNIHSTFLSFIAIAILSLTVLVVTANAQEQLELSGATDATYSVEANGTGDCDDSRESCEPGTRGDITVTKELDKATPVAAPNTNVCDGATCADGSCAATAEMCGAEEPIAGSVCSGFLCDNGECVSSSAMCGFDFETLPNVPARCAADANLRCGDGSCATTPVDCPAESNPTLENYIREGGRTIDAGSARAQNHNSSRSNRTDGIAADSVCNGFLCDSGECVTEEAMCGLATEAGVEIRDEDSDDDGLEDGTMRAQDYNAARSNKPTRSAFSDVDSDGRPEVVLLTNDFIVLTDINDVSGPRQAEDGEVVCWGRAVGEDGRVYAWGQGICVALQATENASDTATARLAALQVRGDDVRAWSEEQRTAWRAYQDNKASTSAQERQATKMITQTQANDRIESIEADDSEVSMRYQTQMRVLGIFSIERTVTATAAADGEVVIDYPWYRFLSQVPEEATIKSILAELSATDDQTTPLLYQ